MDLKALCKALWWSAGLLAGACHAQMSPVGVWHTIDDATQQPKGEVRITQNAAGILSGVVERSLVPSPSTETMCTLCTDDRKGQPKIGMEIIRGAPRARARMSGKAGKSWIPKTARSTACA